MFFSVQNSRYNIKLPSCGQDIVHDVRLALEANGATLWADEAASTEFYVESQTLTLQFNTPALLWTIRFRDGQDAESGLISSTIQNEGPEPVRLGRCRLAEIDGVVDLGTPKEESLVFYFSGSHGDTGVRRIEETAVISKTLVQLHNPKTSRSLHLGFATFDRVSTAHEVARLGNRLSVSSYCDFEGYALPAGAAIDSETLLIQTHANPRTSLDRWADLVQTHYQPKLPRKIPAGWVGWAWTDLFKVENYEAVLRRNCEAIRERLPGLDIDYLWISMGNLQSRRSGDWLNWNHEQLPSGPQGLVAYLDSLDFKLGLWIAPFWLNSTLTQLTERFKGALLKRDSELLRTRNPQWGDSYLLDPTHPEVEKYITDVFSTYSDWGIRYYMVDFLQAISGSTPGAFLPDSFFDESLPHGPAVFRHGMQLIRDAMHPETYIVASTGPTFQATGLAEGARTGNDYGEGRPLDAPGRGFYPATFAINDPSFWSSHKEASEALAMNSFVHNKLFLADCGNVLTIDKPVPVSDAQISATIFGINGGPIMLGDDIAGMAPERLQMIRQLFPRLPECAHAVDLFESIEPDYPKIFHLPVHTEWDNWSLLAVFNYEDTFISRTVSFESLALEPGQSYVAWDFWNERYHGRHEDKITLEVPARSVQLIRLSQKPEFPWLISTDIHIRQGQAEIRNVHYDADDLSLTFQASSAPGSQGNVFLRVPKGLALTQPAGLWIALDVEEGCLIVRVPLQFDEAGKAEKRIGFESFWRQTT